jgi:DNA-binding MarR family transcriptional regulator
MTASLQAPVGTPISAELSSLLLGLLDLMKRRMIAASGPHDLSPPQMQALRALTVSGPVPMRELAGLLHCDASNVTGLTDRLEARGLVERRQDDHDRRVKTLALTEDGHELVSILTADLTATSPVSVLDDQEQAQLRDLLRAVVERNAQLSLSAE